MDRSHGRGRVLVLFADAFGPRQATRFGELLPFIETVRPVEGVLGYSSGALATILTGAPPRDHGRMCLFSVKPAGARGILAPLRWLGLLPAVVHERARVRRLVARAFSRAERLTGYFALHRVPPEAFPWLDVPEREDLFQAERVGRARTFLADARAAGLSVYAAPWQKPEHRRWQEVHEVLREHRPDLTFLYAAGLDAVLHEEGNHGARAERVMRTTAAHLQRVREKLTADGAPLATYIVGDHGMADVHRFVDPRVIGGELPRRRFVDSTMLRMWGDGRTLARARLAIERVEWPGRWLDEQDLRERDAPVDGAPYGSAMFLLDEGSIFAPSWVGGRAAGMHGYDLSADSAQAVIASDAPLPAGCARLSDMAQLVRAQLGLVP